MPIPLQAAVPYQSGPSWTKSERKNARKGFDQALLNELQEIMDKTKELANGIQQPFELWDLEAYLTERRKEIDRKYDFRESMRSLACGRLLYEGRLTEEQLQGLGDHLREIQGFADFLRRQVLSSAERSFEDSE